jgi:ubiquinone/menaquinone biosynthesis C-methylase UbiE
MEEVLYNDKLGNEWIDWVETLNPNGTREKEIFPFIKKWLEIIKPKKLVDLGCGQGDCSKLINQDIEYIGIDQSPILIKRAKELYQETNKSFIKGSVFKLLLDNNFVDAAISIWVWSHLDNLGVAAGEMERILKPGGKFLIITASPLTYEKRKTFYKNYKVEGNLLTGDFDLGGGKSLSNSTLYLHNREDMEKAIKNNNLIIDSIDKMGRAESSDDGLYIVITGHKN